MVAISGKILLDTSSRDLVKARCPCLFILTMTIYQSQDSARSLRGSNPMILHLRSASFAECTRICARVCHVRQSLHGGALVVRRKVRVLTRNRGAFVTDNLARHEIGNTGGFEHGDRAVAQTVKRNLAGFARLVAPFARGFVSARSRLNKSSSNENIPELVRQRRRALRVRCAGKNESVGVVARWQ